MKKLSKRGDVSISFIIGLIMAIVGLAVILFFLFLKIDYGEQSEEEACRLSILTRSSMESVGTGVGTSLAPIKCKTKKICITTNKGRDKCNQFFGEKKVEYVEINIEKEEEAQKKIENVIAEEQYSCWEMMGEGKLALFGETYEGWGGFFSSFITTKEIVGPGCIICSRVALSEDIKEEMTKENSRIKRIIKNINMAEYLTKYKPEGSDRTYFELLTGSDRKEIPSLGEKINPFLYYKENDEEKKINEITFLFAQIRVNDENAIEAGLKSSLKTGILLFGLTKTPVTSLPARIIGGKLTLAIGAILATTSGVSSAIQQAENIRLANAKCGKFESKMSHGKMGCSLIEVRDYNNIKDINNICAFIEGEP